jgi:hypothetical protein
MRVLIAAKSSGGIVVGEESCAGRDAPYSAATDEAVRVREEILVPLRTLPEAAHHEVLVRCPVLDHFQADVAAQAGTAPAVLEHQDSLPEEPPEAAAEQWDRRTNEPPLPQSPRPHVRNTHDTSLGTPRRSTVVAWWLRGRC